MEVVSLPFLCENLSRIGEKREREGDKIFGFLVVPPPLQQKRRGCRADRAEQTEQSRQSRADSSRAAERAELWQQFAV